MPAFAGMTGERKTSPMGLFTFLLILQTMIAFFLIVIILMQRSEGGGLAGGGSPAGMMSARGASDFLTRGTAILATIFVAMSILLAALAAGQRGTRVIDPNLARPIPAAPASQVPGQAPLAIPGAQPKAAPAPPPARPAPGNQSGVPLAQ
jgi:preprotein translocase subunit SecG